jgi:type III pantothenate kinase
MAIDSPAALVAVDVGNTKIHLGVFRDLAGPMPRPLPTLQLHARDDTLDPIAMWAQTHAGECQQWMMTSVNSPAAERLTAFLAEKLPDVQLTRLTHHDAPLAIEVDFPERVGIDRLMASVAAGALREPRRAAIVICAGTAITVNVVAANGAFQGGAILPGMAMSSQILERYTDKLPWVDTEYLHGPPVIGKNTSAALASGIYWGTVGALTKLIEKIAATIDAHPQVFITGGDAPRLATQLPAARHVPDLVLTGIALTARHLVARAAAESGRQ